MGFVKVVKNKAYFKRFQVKYKRRRECKTDYYARKRLILQDKNKYKTPKYRFVVRRTNRDIVCQIFSSDLTHDVCLAAAYSHELKRYGIKVGPTNYAAAYATGLLLARRVNDKLKLEYKGKEKADGEDYDITEEAEGQDKAPFKALFDIGLFRTTTGARVFGALKGAVDGGLNIPHNGRRFPGSSKDGKDIKSDAETHKKYIVGGHVADYMKGLEEEDKDAFKSQFSRFIKNGITAKNLSKMYTDAHTAIRKEPFKKRDPLELGRFKTRKAAKDPNAKFANFLVDPNTKKKTQVKQLPISAKQRHFRLRQKLTAVGLPLIKEKKNVL